ncbi:Fic family protein [Puniceicoccaceae bacterium K14]|nr:Fic family protein [Puniceicoccaceae bacterium K14]
MNPPFTITSKILEDIGRIERLIGRVEGLHQPKPQPHLRKSNRVRTVQGSLAIEGNTLDLEQVTALIEGKVVIGKKEEIQEVLNAVKVYDSIERLDPYSMKNFLKSHGVMMRDLADRPGKLRSSNVGIIKGSVVSHVAPQADRLDPLMKELFAFLKNGEHHALIRGCVFHYELEFIHPFVDGNGRIGRFWHSLLLYDYHPVFEYIPVESLIKENQKEYYKALEASDRIGNSTPFVEFSLSVIHQALADFLDVLQPAPFSPKKRLEIARSHFGDRSFSRKDYIRHLKTISSATASRDLKLGVEQKFLSKEGANAQTKYRYI